MMNEYFSVLMMYFLIFCVVGCFFSIYYYYIRQTDDASQRRPFFITLKIKKYLNFLTPALDWSFTVNGGSIGNTTIISLSFI